jgi:hypothetical protein
MITTDKSLESLIEVHAPYNILYDISPNTDNGLNAKVKNEYLLPNEGAPIGVAEAGRHMAIMGSMV